MVKNTSEADWDRFVELICLKYYLYIKSEHQKYYLFISMRYEYMQPHLT